MAENRLTVDTGTVFDNANERQVEFDAELGGERLPFALRYDVLEALAGEIPDDRPVALFHQHRARVELIGPSALARGTGVGRTVITEADLDQPASAAGHPGGR